MNRSQLTIMDIIHTLLTHLLVILLTGALAGACAWAYTTYRVPKMYRTTVTFYALSNVNQQQTGEVTTTVQSASRQLASTYSYVLRSNLVMKDAAERLEVLGVKTPSGGSYSYNALKAMTSVATTNTEIFTATFSSSDRDNLQIIANTIAESGTARIQEIVGGEARILDAAEAPGAPYSPNVQGNTVTGAAIGLLVAAAIVILRALTDTTIWTEEDLSKQYNIPVLGSVPQLLTAERQTVGKEKQTAAKEPQTAAKEKE